MTKVLSESDIQVKNFKEKHNVVMRLTFLGLRKHFPGDKEKRNVYHITIDRNIGFGRPGKEQSMYFNFGDSIRNTEHYKKPTSYSILACLTKYEPGDFAEFASEFGYALDTAEEIRTAQQVHLAVRKEWEDVQRVFGDVLDELREIQ